MKSSRVPLLIPLLYLLFFLSGAAGLIYQVTWTRMFVSVFGNTTYAVSAVLSAFMAGLALGSFLFGRFIDTRGDELKLYALLELGIGLSALAIPPALHLLDTLYAAVYQQLSFSLVALTVIRTFFSFLVLLLPTTLMGATLPVLSKFATDSPDQIPIRVGLLYALNTLGAALGCFATGFFFLEALGVRGSSHLAVAANLALALAFLLLHRRVKTATPSPASQIPTTETPPPSGSSRTLPVLLAAALTGFAALGYEVLWSRLLVFKLKTTNYAFAIMLTTFLLGIGLGSGLLAAVESRRKISNYPRLFGWLEGAIGLLGIGTIYLFGQLDQFFGTWATNGSARTAEQLLLASSIMLIPALLMGASFPVLIRIHAQHQQRIGATVGNIYASNTLGAVLGALITGFLLVRLLGTQHSLILMGLLNLGIATLGFYLFPAADPEQRQTGRLGSTLALWALAVVAILAIPRDLLFQYYNAGEKEMDSQVQILHAIEGSGGITTIHRLPNGDRVVSTGSINVAGTSLMLRSTQKLQAHIPMLLHGHPGQVLQIGFGSGETAHLLTTYPIERLDIAEISQSVIDAADRFFRDINHGVIAEPRFTAFIMDGANYLRLTDRRYDVIMNDSIWPFYAGNSGLYTREHFLAGRRHLRPGGVMTSWLPLDMRLESFETILKTFHSVFPHFSVWFTPAHYTKHALLVGSLEPLRIDVPGYLQQFSRHARADLEAVDLTDPVLLLDSFAADEKTLANELADAPIHTIDNPVLEFVPSKPVYQSQLAIYKMLARQRSPVFPYLDNTAALGEQWPVLQQQLQITHQATRHVLQGMILREENLPGSEREFALAARLRPDHPGVLSSRSDWEFLRNLDLTATAGRSYKELLGLAGRLARARLYPKAEAVLRQASALEPDDPRAHSELGLVLSQAGRPEEAIPQFERAVELDPQNADTHNNLANLLSRQQRFTEAEAQYRQALDIDPALPEAHYGLGMVLYAREKVEEAIRKLEEALRLRPEYTRAHINLGILLDGQQRSAAAIAHFREAVRLAPADATANNNLVIALTRLGRFDEAARHLELSTQRLVDLPLARRTLVTTLANAASSHAEKGALDSAVVLQRQAVSLTPPKLQPPLREQLEKYASQIR